MDKTHTAKNINVSIRKVRALIPGVRKLTPLSALERLKHMPHSGARALADAIQTALINGENTLKASRDMLEFRRLSADQGMVMKRYRAGSRGTARPILRRMTHITVTLAVSRSPQLSAPKTSKKSAKQGATPAKVQESEKAQSKTKEARTPTKKTQSRKARPKKEQS